MSRTLVLGGTAWLGREIARQLVARGDDVTCLARGAAGEAAAGATLVRADRRAADAYDEVAVAEWDDVVELSYEPDLVAGALAALAPRARHWTLVSSVSVYADASVPGADETADLVEPDGPIDPDDYAQAKVAAERACTAALGDRLLIARPGLIVGAGDPSDRFGYWPARFALAGDEAVLVPPVDARAAQFVDAQDVAAWVIDAGHRGLTGPVDVVGRELALADVLDAAARVAGFTGPRIEADDDWLIAQDVRFWAGPRSLPLWLPREDGAFTQRSGARFRSTGGTTRELAATLGDVLADERSRGLARPRRSGLTRAEELALLSALR